MADTKKKIYWARPITTYSRTHKLKLQAHFSAEHILQDEFLEKTQKLYAKCIEREEEVYAHLTCLGYEVVDPGSKKVVDAFEAWKVEPLTKVDTAFNVNSTNQHEFYQTLDKAIAEYKTRLANPMPFFTQLCDDCDDIMAMPFSDKLQSDEVPNVSNRLGCGVVKEVDSVVNRETPGGVVIVTYGKDSTGPFVFTSDPIDWKVQRDLGHMFTCLDYPQTKALLVLEGYESRSSQYKKAPEKIFWTRSFPQKSYYWREKFKNASMDCTELEKNLMHSFIEKCQKDELAMHTFLTQQGYDIVDAGNPSSMDDFERWRSRSTQNKANPVLFYEILVQTCHCAVVTPFLPSSSFEGGAENTDLNVTCGIVKEMNALACAEQSGDIFIATSHAGVIDFNKSNWRERKVCGKPLAFLSRPKTLELLKGYGHTSRSQTHKNKQK